MPQNPTVIVGHLNDKELTESINKLVEHVDQSTRKMVNSFNSSIDEMKKKLAELGKEKIDLGSIVTGSSTSRGGVARQAKESVAAYDMMARGAIRLIEAQKNLEHFQNKRTFSSDELNQYSAALQRVRELTEQYGQVQLSPKTFMNGLDVIKSMPARTLDEYMAKLQRLQTLQKDMRVVEGMFDEKQFNKVQNAINSVISKIEKFKSTTISPSASQTTNNIFGISDSELAKVERFKSSYQSVKQEFDQIQQELSRIKEKNSAWDEMHNKILSVSKALHTAKAEIQWYEYQQKAHGASSLTSVDMWDWEKQKKLASELKEELQKLWSQRQNVPAPTREDVSKFNEYTKRVQELQEQLRQLDEIKPLARLTQKIQHQAEIIRQRLQESGLNSAQWGNAVIYREGYNENLKKTFGSIESQLMAAHKASEEAMARQAQLKAHQAAEQQRATEAAQQQAQVEQQITQEQERRSSNVQPKTFQNYEDFRAAIAHVLGVQRSEVQLADEQTASYNKLAATLSQLQNTYNKLNASERNSENGKALIASMHEVESAMKRIKAQASRMNWDEIMGMPEKSLADLRAKMQELMHYRDNLNLTNPNAKDEITNITKKYDELKKKQDEVVGANARLANSNKSLTNSYSPLGSALERSLNYMKNRLAFYFTVGASTAFVKQLIEIRSQYELLERSIGILTNSMQNGTKIFQELNAMALKSPFTTIELGAAAKQLVAFDIAADDVVDTTKRLADMAAAVGVPIERLTYALGQIKTYGYLNSRDARMFSNAGIPLVKQLAEYYTEVEGRLVSMDDVYGRIKKKEIGFEDVMLTINKMTDEGGKFFNYQERAADTLKIKLANLTLAYNTMLNQIGESNQGLIEAPIQGLKTLFQHWKNINHILTQVIVGYGLYKATQFIVNNVVGKSVAGLERKIMAERREAAMQEILTRATQRKLTSADYKELAVTKSITVADYQKILAEQKLTTAQAINLVTLNKKNFALHEALIATGTLTKAQVNLALRTNLATLGFQRVRIAAVKFGNALKAFGASTWWMFLLSALYEIYNTWRTYAENINELNKSISESAKESFDSIHKYLENDANDIKNMLSNATTSARDTAKAWENMREKIMETTPAAKRWISELESYDDINKRLRVGISLMEQLRDIDGVLKTISDDAIEITSDWVWGLFGEGLKSDLQDFSKSADEVQKKFKEIGDAAYLTERYKEMIRDLGEFKEELLPTIESLLELSSDKGFGIIAQREVFERTMSEIAKKQELSTKEYRQLRINAEELYYTQAMLMLDKEIEYASGKRKQQLKENQEFLMREFGTRKSLQDEFFTWLQEQQTTETLKRFSDMSKSEIEHIDWSKGEWADWARKLAKDFSTEYGFSFDKLHKMITQANTWSINIPVYFETIGKELEDVVADYEARTGKKANADVKSSETQVEVLKKLRDEQEKLEEQIETARTAGGDYWIKNKDELEQRNQSLIDDIHAYNALTKAEEKAKKNKNKTQKKEEDVIATALQKEIQLINEMRNNYEKLRKSGVETTEAIELASQGYEDTILRINNTLQKFGIDKFNASNFAGKDVKSLLRNLEMQRNTLLSSGKVKLQSLQSLDVEIKKLTIDAKAYDMKKISDGLNNELSKLKEDYELAVELDANPELGDMFADMMGIDVSALPHTFADVFGQASKIAKSKLKELGVEMSDFDILSTIIKGDSDNRWMGLDMESEPIKELLKQQKTYRDMFKKVLVDTEKDLDNYVKKYGGYADKIAEIEANRLEQLKRLNNAYYTEEMRQRPEYIAKLNAIEKGAERETSQVKFDDFKNSRYYTMMFENLDYVSTKAIRDMRQRLIELKDDMNDLTPEQLKTIIQQYEKLEQKLVKRSPFRTLGKDLKAYLKVAGKRKAVENEFRQAQDEYDAQKKVLAELKKKQEQNKANQTLNEQERTALDEEIAAQEEVLHTLEQQVNVAEKKADEYNLIRKLALSEVSAVIDMVGANIQSLGQLRDFIQEMGIDLGDAMNGFIDGLTKANEGVQGVMQSAKNGDIVGTLLGVGKMVAGMADGFASLFGGGSAKTRKLNRQIAQSEEAVRKLNMAYKELERTVDSAMGAEELRARRSEIANKRAQLAELERQMALERQKRSKDRDDDKIKQYEESIQDLRNEIDDLIGEVSSTILGSSVKDAAESFVDTWVNAWREGSDTMDAIGEKFDDMIDTMIAKSLASSLVSKRIKKIWEAVDEATNEESVGGAEITLDELQKIKSIIGDKTIAEQINEDLTKLYNALGIAYGSGSGADKNLSALQQGIQGVTEETAGAIEAYMNGMSQQVYLQSDLLTEIRDTLNGFEIDIQTATMSQILLQLQQSYAIQIAIQNTLNGALNPSGRAFMVELTA